LAFSPISTLLLSSLLLSLSSGIIGGNEVVPHSRPYMAYLKIQVTNNTGTFHSYCGGFLIRPDAVLSAAHCSRDLWMNVTVILGAHNIRVQEQSQQRIRVRNFVVHPNYDPDGHVNDIALLKVWPNKSFLPGDLPLLTSPTSELVAGWGRTSLGNNRTNVMMEGRGNLFFKAGRACLTPLIPFMTQGDSGGPLICNQKAHGIVSRRPSGLLFPAAFTRVSHFVPWIPQQLRRFALQELPASPSSQ
uniref:Peptidase S1 domain-containing protein n=1 Tax=Catharus ustulatus TaxID=91951 RepID=A0A8C3UVS9_CATUS